MEPESSTLLVLQDHPNRLFLDGSEGALFSQPEVGIRRPAAWPGQEGCQGAIAGATAVGPEQEGWDPRLSTASPAPENSGPGGPPKSNRTRPDRCGSVGRGSSHKEGGLWFDSWSGHMPGLRVRSLVGVCVRQSIDVFLSLLSPLKINKTFKKTQ